MARGRKVFISYAKEDEAAAVEVYESLLVSGYYPWMDVFDLLPGENWRLEIERQIKRADFFVACLSTNSVSKRGYFQRELKVGVSVLDELPEHGVYLIPVRLDQCPVPTSLSSRQWIDWFCPGAKERLVEAIAAGRGGSGLTAGLPSPRSRFAHQIDQSVTMIRAEFFDALLGSDSTGDASTNYRDEQRSRFWRAEFHSQLQELTEFRRFLIQAGLQKEMRGKRWLTAIEASMGDVLSHAISPRMLRANPEFGINYLDRLTFHTPEPTDPLAPHYKLAWGALIRKGGEVAARQGVSKQRLTNMLTRALKECEGAYASFDIRDPMRIHAAGELMAIMADMEILHPSLARAVLRSPGEFIAKYEEGRDMAERLGRTADWIAPLIVEFNVRWTMRRVLANLGQGEQRLPSPVFQRLDDELNHAERMINEVGASARILEINAAVTRSNLLSAAGYPVPESLKMKTASLVTRAGDNSQAYRLRTGTQLNWC